MRWWIHLGVCSLLLAAPGGCSDDGEGQEITASQAEEIWSSTSQAVTQVNDNLVGELRNRDSLGRDGGLLPDRDGGLLPGRDGGLLPDRDGGGGWLTGTLGDFQVNGTVDNPAGAGSATITGTGGRSGTTWSVQLTITFQGWVTQSGMIINGSLTLDYALTGLSPLAMNLTVSGAPKVTVGKIPLPAAVDVRVTVSGTTTTVCGTVAGQPVGEGACP